MLVTVLVFISISLMPQTVAKFQQTALFRDQKRHVNVGNFKADIQHKLIVTKITSSLVADRFDSSVLASRRASLLTLQRIQTPTVFMCVSC